MEPLAFIGHLPLSTTVVLAALAVAVVILAIVTVRQQRRMNQLERKLKRTDREPLYRGDRF